MNQLTRAVPLVALFGFLVLIGLGGCSATSEGLSDLDSVAADKAALVIGYAGTDSAASVTQDMTLPTTGDNGTTISWTSSDTTVIADTGAVTRPAANAADATVTLTATITKNTESDTKEFTLTVLKDAGLSDTESVAAAKTALVITYAQGDSETSVTQDMTLPTTGASGTTISWTSSDTAVIANNGAVTRPAANAADATVTLTATITKNEASDTKIFTLTVIKKDTVEANRAPGAPAFSGSTAGDGQVEVNWTAPIDKGIINGDGSEGTITKYTVYWGDSTGFTRSDDKKADVTDTTNTTYTITGLTNGEAVFFIVTASNATGEGAASTEGSATPPVAVTSVAIDDKATTVVTMGGTLQLSATVEPNDATNKGLIWSSGDTSKATVDASGLVTPVAVGGPIAITVTSDADNAKSDSIAITVKEGIKSIGYGAIIGTKDVAISRVTPTIDPQGATGTFSISISSGTLPSGLNLDSGSGEISGTPDQLTTEAVSVTIAMIGTGDYTGTVTGEVTIEVKYGIGSTGPAGGIVFYDKGSITDEWRYLEAAPSDLPGTYKWGDTTTSVTTGEAIGTGESNTGAIIVAMDGAGFTEDYAAKACADFIFGEMNDWFLPSKDELNELYKQKTSVGGFQSSYYWSSSEHSAAQASRQLLFSGGTQSTADKSEVRPVRAVRAF